MCRREGVEDSRGRRVGSARAGSDSKSDEIRTSFCSDIEEAEGGISFTFVHMNLFTASCSASRQSTRVLLAKKEADLQDLAANLKTLELQLRAKEAVSLTSTAEEVSTYR